MKKMFVAIVALGLLASSGVAQAQYDEEEVPYTESRGFIGALLGAGFGVNQKLDTGTKAYVDTSALFALRGGVLLGKLHRGTITLEFAPVSNKLDWTLHPVLSGFVSGGQLVQIKNDRAWAWHWKVGIGLAGGWDYRMMIGARLDVLSFNYKWSDRLWVDFGLPSIRFYIEMADQARYNAAFVFPLGITFAI